jgi:hypothetical protein
MCAARLGSVGERVKDGAPLPWYYFSPFRRIMFFYYDFPVRPYIIRAAADMAERKMP